MRSTIAIVLCMLVSVPSLALAQSVVGGDTLMMGRLKYRLCGINAPEFGHPGYREAADHLRKLIRNKMVKCTPVGQGTPCDGRAPEKIDDRIVATCFVDGKDLAAEMVRSGHARDWPKFSGGYYSR